MMARRWRAGETSQLAAGHMNHPVEVYKMAGEMNYPAAGYMNRPAGVYKTMGE